VAKATFTAEVLTPEGEVFKDEVEMVSTRTTVGSIGILANHQPLLGMLDPTELRLYRSDDDIVRFAQGEGYVQVGPEGVLILVEDAIAPADLDVATLREQLKQAQGDLDGAADGTEAARLAAQAVKRYETFLAVAGGDAE
jgi:F-type H+-transporting ATPase subunit epsilon